MVTDLVYNNRGQILQGMEACSRVIVNDTEICKSLCFQES